MKTHSPRIYLLLSLLLALTLACGLSKASPEPTEAPVATDVPATEAAAATEAPVAADTPAPADTPVPQSSSMAVSALDEIQPAVVQIEAQGTFVDPGEGVQLNAAGRGSGFIVDESGIAVTNNHVVTGAALLKVWVGGEDTPRNARILGVSECSDLAVIDIEGDGYPYFEWFDGEIKPGLDVYAAGFPLGDPEFTLTRGIVSKASADGETDWASVDRVLEHDATINPGNSGGPLVTPDGKVVGVNYAGDSGTNQYFAIAPAEALPVIDALWQGSDVDSIGINGTAVSDGESIYGVWVSSVQSGSPADNVGIIPGDIVTSLEGLLLAIDGTLADYCDILRTHSPDDVMSVEVLRLDTEEYLAGQLNGEELSQSFSFAQTLGDEVGNSDNAAPAGETYAEYVTLIDDSDAIQVEVPAAWGDTNGSNWLFEDVVVGSAIAAAPSIEAFWDNFETPGVFFGASSVLAQRFDVTGLLDTVRSDICTYDGRFEYSDELYAGQYDMYSECGDDGSVIIDLVAAPSDNAFLMWLQVQVVNDADLDALDHILASFQVIGPLPGGDGTTIVSPTATPEASVDIPAEWFPPAGQASIVLVNDAGADLVFTMDNQEHKLTSGTSKVAFFNPGTYTYTASDPRYDSLNSECTVNPDTIYYWYTDDSSWGSCYQVYP